MLNETYVENTIKEWVKEAGLLISCIYEFYEMGTCDETEKVRTHLQAAKELAKATEKIIPKSR